MVPLPTWTVAQIGARRSYSVARAFAAAGRLDRLYTDIWCRVGSRVLSRGPAPLRALAGRRHSGVPDERVVSFSGAGMLGVVRARLWPLHGAALYDEFLRVGRWFDRRMVSHIGRRPLPPGPQAYFAFTTGCLETVKVLRDRGVFTVVTQVDPARVEYEIARREAAKWPGWAPAPPEIPDAYFDRLAAEWDAADAVVVNSKWSADALVQQGVPREKLHVLPLSFEPDADADNAVYRTAAGSKDRPVVVLWLGNVIRRKGIQYLVEAARLLAGRPIRFVVVGPIGISKKAIAEAPPSVEFVGPVTRDRTGTYYRSADLFVLPTLSDGFAITQLEAMAHGLPVVATPCCGAVVEHGADGLIVPAGDAAALATAVADLADDPDKRANMGRRALLKARTFSLANVASSLDAVTAGRRPR
jgi:glycosyltransferase involved in cell wall biosynthesis